MAIEHYGVFIITCDDPTSEICWEETVVRLEEGEPKEKAIEFVKSIGWEILADNLCVCPGCGEKGQTQEEYQKSLSKIRKIKG